MSDYPSQAVRMEARSNVSVRTKQHFAPTAIQGLEVLSLPVARLDAYVRDLVERNPLLDFDYDHGSLSFEELPDEEDGDAAADAETAAEGFDARPPSAIAWDARGFDLARLRDECSQTETLHSHVRMQLTGVRVGEEDRALLDALIENIDDDGYFSGSMHALCAEADQYLTEDFYLFSTDGRMLYSAQEEPVLTALPERKDALFEAPEGGYTAQRPSSHGDFIYLKQLPKNTVVGQITNSLYFSLFTAAAALIFGAAIAVVSVWRVLHPVQDILQLFSSGDAPPSGKVDELHYIQANVETMLRQREQYVQQISKKDAALSGFLLQSQLKNIYVELDVPDQISSAEDLVFYILYFRIHYRNGALDTITAEPPAVSHMLLENLRQTLSLLFVTALIFQLEPNQFVAKVSLPAARQDISDQMQYLLQRLDNEREFAFFTVVQSGALGADGDFTAIYDQVLDAAQYAVVEDRTQLLHLPLGLDVVNTFFFPSEMEQQLRALVCGGHSDEAAALAERIIAQNLSAGIRRIHMILLGSAIANVTLRALSDLHLEGGLPNLNSGSVYNELPQCDTAQDYRELMSGFVRSAALCAAAQPRAEEPILEGVQAFLEKNYQREFSMDELAEALHLSKSYLSTYYKSKTGANLSDRIQCFRIQKAVELLADPKLRIGDIGALVGINNVNTFLRQFKKYTGMTPREYRLRKLSMQ